MTGTLDAPRTALCLLSSGDRFEAPVLRIGTTSVFLQSEREDLRFSEGLQVTLIDRHGPVLTFHGQVATWVRRSGARVECDAHTDPAVLEQLAEWSSEDSPTDTAIPRTGEVPVLSNQSPGRPSTPSPARLRATPHLRELMAGAEPPAAPPTWGAEEPMLPPTWGGEEPMLPPDLRDEEPMLPPDLGGEEPMLPPIGGAAAASGGESAGSRPRSPSKPRLDVRVLGHPAASTALAGIRVLVIDDDPGIVRLLERSLKKFGCVVTGTDDPPAGLQIAANQQADVVVMDWVLPAIPGARLLEQLRRVLKDTPIAVISGALWWDEAEQQILDMGATTVLEKPIDFEKLVDFLQSARTSISA